VRTREVLKTSEGCHNCNRTQRASRGHASSSSLFSNAIDEDEILQNGPGLFILSFMAVRKFHIEILDSSS
jgi:hypothetical protein